MSNKNKVNEETADLIHRLLTDSMEVGLRTQLQSGEINPALLGKVIDWLKYNQIQVVDKADKQMTGLAHLLGSIDIDNL